MKAFVLPFIAFFLGVVFEGYCIAGDVSRFLKVLGTVFIFSLFFFVFEGKHPTPFEPEMLLSSWLPWASLFLTIVFIASIQRRKIIPRLGQGLTFLSTLSLLYMALEFSRRGAWPAWGWIFLLPSAHTFYCAFRSEDLSRSARMLLSLWNALMSLAFGLFTAFTCMKLGLSYRDSMEGLSLEKSAEYFVQFFMIGGASLYIYSNFSLFLAFLPMNRASFQDSYEKGAKRLAEEHIERYSPYSIAPFHAFVALFLHAGPLIANYFLHWAKPSALLFYSISLSPLLVILAISRLPQGRPVPMKSSS